MSNARLVTAARYSASDQLPLRLRDEIRAVEGVEAVTHQTWFGGFYQEPTNDFPKFVVEPRAYFEMFPDTRIDVQL